jgi:lipid II isoglutaminyl synthase (glutamine-hydrolysing)
VPDLRIVHLYPELLHTYGDRGNVLALARRAEARRIAVEIVPVSRDDPMPETCSLVFIGGGSDRIQKAIGNDLMAKRDRLHELAARGTVFFGVCGGYQLLGHRYVALDGSEIEGLHLLDIETLAGTGRIIGRVAATPADPRLGERMIGFENHGGRTYLGPRAQPLAHVRRKRGNNGKDRSEGAIQNGVAGTYLHGPVLPLNPALADHLIARALGVDALEPADDPEAARARAAWGRERRH